MKCRSDEQTKLSPKVSGAERIFIVPDPHCPFQDPKAVSLAKQLYDAFKPTRTIHIGDSRDILHRGSFYVPKSLLEGYVRREFLALREFNKLFSTGLVQRIRGNHEAGLVRYLDEHPELKGMEEFDLDAGYPGLTKNNFVSVAQGNFIVTHGSVVRSSPGASAAGELKKWGKSGCSGHTHRLSRYYERNYSGVKVWVEAGHLAMNPPHYAKMNDPTPFNWQQGVVIIYVEGNSFHAEDIPFTLKYRAFLNGIRYGA